MATMSRPPQPSGGIATDRSPSFSLPLRYFLLGIVCFVLTMGGLALFGRELAEGTTWSPHLLALTHLLTLGCIVSMIMGATYQLVPVVLLARIYSERLGKLIFWAYGAGLLGMIGGFWTWSPGVLGVGATLVVGAIALFLLNVLVSLLKGASWSNVGAYLVGGLVMLAAAGTLGALRVLGYAQPAHSVALSNVLPAHAHLAAFGFASLLIFGVSYRLVSMFAVTHGHERYPWPVFGLGLGGVLALACGELHALPYLPRLGAVLMAMSAWLWCHDIWRMYQGRTRRKLDVGLTLSVSALFYLCAGSVLGILLAWDVLPAGISPERWMVAYALLGLVGWISFSIMGQFYKIMPFLAWYHRYSSLVGKAKVPLIKDLYDERVGWGGFYLSHLGLLVMTAAVLAGQGWLIQVGGALSCLGAAAIATMVYQTLTR